MLDAGQQAEIVGVATSLPAAERRRLLEMGLYPGTRVCAVLTSPLGDPVAYRVRGMTVALRRAQARNIEIRRDR